MNRTLQLCGLTLDQVVSSPYLKRRDRPVIEKGMPDPDADGIKSRALQMRAQGFKQAYIAQQLNRSQAYISKIINANKP